MQRRNDDVFHAINPMTESFPYHAKPGRMLFAALFFGGAMAFFFHRAATNDRGLIINGLLELGQGGATVFFAVLGGLSAAFVLTAIAAVVMGQAQRPVLTLADDHVIIPQGFFKRRLQRIDLGTVTALDVQKINGQEFLHLRTTGGKASIARSLLHPEAAFDRIVAVLSSHLDATRK